MTNIWQDLRTLPMKLKQSLFFLFLEFRGISHSCVHTLLSTNYSYLSHRSENICSFFRWKRQEPDSVVVLGNMSQITASVQNYFFIYKIEIIIHSGRAMIWFQWVNICKIPRKCLIFHKYRCLSSLSVTLSQGAREEHRVRRCFWLSREMRRERFLGEVNQWEVGQTAQFALEQGVVRFLCAFTAKAALRGLGECCTSTFRKRQEIQKIMETETMPRE